MKKLEIFFPPFWNNNHSLIFTLFVLIFFLLAQRSANRGVPAHKLRDLLRNPSARLAAWGRRVRSTDDSGTTHHPLTIDRPAHCGQNQTLYIDCFLCGKVADEVLIYRWCCERETETIRFCTQLLL